MRRIAALTIGVVIAGAVPVDAQYFGRNKVRYEAFDFRVMETPHFDIHYYPEAEEAVAYAARLAERWYLRLSHALDHEFRERQPIVLYASHSHFSQTTVVPGFLGEGIGGLMEHQRGRLVLPFTPGLGETERVLGHELVHAFQRDILRQRKRSIATLPLWFLEGMAEYMAVGTIDPNTAMWLRDAALDERLPHIDQLDDPKWFPYRFGQALWSYLADRFGEDVVVRALKSPAAGGAIGRLTDVTGVDVKTLSKDWHKAMHAAARSVKRAADTDTLPRPVIAGGQGGGRLNVGPALSPDGREIVFISERDRYSIDVFLADAETGVIKRKLVQTAANPQFESLQFIASAGAWDRSGQQFVFAAVSRGQPVLSIIDTRTGQAQQDIVLGDLDEVFNPSWSPDGRRLAFSALKGGFSDIYVLDLGTTELRALTSDAFADLHPSWSPDGRTIAFATDRFSSSLYSLTFGSYRLGVIDVTSGNIRELPGLPGAKHIDPHWSADGASIYFVADAEARSNVYRLHVETGDLFRVTNVETGVSGVSAASPALSVAGGSPRMAFSVYRHGAYQLYVMNAGDGTPVASTTAPGAIPFSIAPSSNGPVTPPAFASLADLDFTTKPYKRTLSLDGIGQPYLTAGGGAFGTFIRAGVGFSFGDMLGQHSLHTALQVGRHTHDFAVRTAYVNRQSRWNWAVVGEQVPSLLGAKRSSSRPAGADGPASLVTEDVIFRQIHRRVSGVAIYPFTRAERLEFTGGLHLIGFDHEATTSVHAVRTGELLDEWRATRAAPPVRLFETAAAFVHDSAVAGPGSPVLGQRYRLEVAPTLGDLTFATVAADYRRYLMPVRPFTVAVRAKHVGRYGPDAADLRLFPLAFNLRDLVRGYDSRALAGRVCGEFGSTECAARRYSSIQQLLTANVELRFPLLGAFRRDVHYGPLPLEAFLFSDNGWLRGSAVEPGASAHRFLIGSAGAGVRLNVSGFVFEFAAARPFDIPGRGWTMAANFRPGF